MSMKIYDSLVKKNKKIKKNMIIKIKISFFSFFSKKNKNKQVK